MMQFVPITTSDVSLSARRAWIEITFFRALLAVVAVALRKESVDRNSSGLPVFLLRHCRSPQGERG